MLDFIKVLLKKKGAHMVAPKKKTSKKKKIIKRTKTAVKSKGKKKAARKPVRVLSRSIKKTKVQKRTVARKPSGSRSEIKKKRIEYEQIRQMLLKMRSDIIDALTKKKSSLEEEKTVEIEDLDAIAEDRNREYEYLLTTMDTKKLKQIDEALAKIESGTYGFCEDCGEEIPVARLKILPFAKLCIDCASNVEKEEALKQSLESEKDIFTAGNNEEEGDIE